MAKAPKLKIGDRIIIEGEVTRTGEDDGDQTEITVQIDGYAHRVTLPRHRVIKDDG